MQTEKNKWVDEVLGSADGVSRADGPDMTGRILVRAAADRGSSSFVWRIAASVVLLVALNIGTVFLYSGGHSRERTSHSQDAASLFGLGAGDNSQADVGTIFFGN